MCQTGQSRKMADSWLNPWWSHSSSCIWILMTSDSHADQLSMAKFLANRGLAEMKSKLYPCQRHRPCRIMCIYIYIYRLYSQQSFLILGMLPNFACPGPTIYWKQSLKIGCVVVWICLNQKKRIIDNMFKIVNIQKISILINCFGMFESEKSLGKYGQSLGEFGYLSSLGTDSEQRHSLKMPRAPRPARSQHLQCHSSEKRWEVFILEGIGTEKIR